MNNQTNPQEGKNVKHLFAESIANQPDAWNNILKSIGYDKAIGAKIDIEVATVRYRKTGVAIHFKDNCGLPSVRFNIKSFSDSDSSHLERHSLPAFCKEYAISTPDYNFLEELWLRKAKNSKTGLLIKEDEKPRITKIFKIKEPGISAFLGCDHPQILALYSKKLKKFHLYNMSEQVTPLIRTHFTNFTKRASNIQIGDYVFVQRHGAERGENDSTDINHGSNHVQIKMRVKKFFDRVEPISCYQL